MMRNKFNYNLFYKTLSKKSKIDIDIIDLIIKCNGFNVAKWTGVKKKEDVANAFCDNFFELNDYDTLHINSGTYLKTLNDEIDCIPIVMNRTKFWSGDKVRNYDLNKAILNYEYFQIIFYITFLKKKITRILKLKINQINAEWRGTHGMPLNVKFTTFGNTTSRLDIRTLHNSVLSFIDNPLGTHPNEIVLSDDFKWNLDLIKKMYNKQFKKFYQPKIVIIERKNLLQHPHRSMLQVRQYHYLKR